MANRKANSDPRLDDLIADMDLDEGVNAPSIEAPARNKTTKSLTELTRRSNQELAQKQAARNKLAYTYKNQPKVTVSGSPFYQPYFGRTMSISINGVYISVPLDGAKYEVPKSFAAEFNRRIRSVDDDINMRKRLSNIQNNIESFAGELDLVSKL